MINHLCYYFFPIFCIFINRNFEMKKGYRYYINFKFFIVLKIKCLNSFINLMIIKSLK